MSKPSKRPSYRYMKLRIHAEESVKFEELLKAYWNTVPEFIGLRDFSKANAWLIKNRFDYENQQAVLRIERSFEEDFEAAITILDEFGGKEGFLSVENVSGSIGNL